LLGILNLSVWGLPSYFWSEGASPNCRVTRSL
jgi:hypothetical protein